MAAAASHPLAQAGETPRSSPAVWAYLVTGLLLIAGMGLIGALLRATQAHYLAIDPGTFYALLTLHGDGMLVGTLLLLIGAHWYMLRDLLGLRVGALIAAFVPFLAGTLCVAFAVLVGHYATAWTFLYPLPFVGTYWPAWATGLFLLGMLLVGIGFAVYCFDLLAAITRTYGNVLNGLGLDTIFPRLRRAGVDTAPPTVLAATMVGLDGGVTSIAGMVLSVALLARWAVPSFPIDPLWAKNLTYFFGHATANLTMYVAAGVVYGLLPRYAGRPWKTSNVLAAAWVVSLLMVLFAYPHHLYQDFVQPAAVQLVGQTASYLASLPPAVVTIFGALLLIYRSRFRWTLGSIALFVGLLGWTVGGVAALLDATIPFNFVLHNTLWVPAHFHTYLLCGVVLFGLAFVSDLAGEPIRVTARATWGLCLFGVGALGFLTMFYASGIEGVPRRYALEPPPGTGLSQVASWFVLVLIAGLALVALDVAARAWRTWRA